VEYGRLSSGRCINCSEIIGNVALSDHAGDRDERPSKTERRFGRVCCRWPGRAKPGR